MTDQPNPAAVEPASPATIATPAAPNSDPAPAQPSATPAAPAPAADPAAPVADPAAPAADGGELQALRETLAGGDAGLLKQLDRYKSKEAIAKMVKEARTAAERGSKPLVLSDKATAEDIKAYREAVGIPPEAKDYPVAFRDGFKPTDADKNILDSFKGYLHEKSADPRAATAALEWYQDFATAQRQELDGKLAKTAKETQATLRTDWGGDYDGNIGAAAELMTAHLGEEGFGQMMGLRLMDGSRLQDNVAFVKMMAQLGGDYYGGTAIMNGDIETTSKTVQERIDTLLALRVSKPEEYKSDKVQSEITKLYAQRDKISARK